MNNPKFTITSTAFEDGKVIPTKYANTGVTGGKNISIPLKWGNLPKETKSSAVSIIDLHPVANNWVHWFVVNIPANITEIVEGASCTNKIPEGSNELNNTFGVAGYGGPQPPKGSGAHKYEITLYALNVEKVELDKYTSLKTFRNAIAERVIASAKTVGVFERK